MTVAIYTHPDCLEHDTGPMHPENTGRLRALLDALRAAPFADKLSFLEAPLAGDGELRLAHSEHYIQVIRDAAPSRGYRHLDADTIMSPGTLLAALRAAGAGYTAVGRIMNGKCRSAFCATRPPGHHATHDRAMGFCIFNNVAIAALHALKYLGLQRVAVVDFDVHHGNGTQSILEPEGGILYISTHQSPFYPGTGRIEENLEGHILNLPLPHGTDGSRYREVFTEHAIPALDQFRPQLLLVSAGFDAHHDDPLAGMSLTENDYRWIGQQLAMLAQRHCDGKIVSFLEGGYDQNALAASVVAYLEAYA